MGAFTKPIQLKASANDDPATKASERWSNPISAPSLGPGKDKTWNGKNAANQQALNDGE